MSEEGGKREEMKRERVSEKERGREKRKRGQENVEASEYTCRPPGSTWKTHYKRERKRSSSCFL